MDRSKPTETPPPRRVIGDNEVVLAEIRTTVKTIMSTLIPPIADNAKKASEGVIQLLERQQAVQRQLDDQARRLDRLESAPEEHCFQTETLKDIQRQMGSFNEGAAKRQERVDSLSKWRGYLAAILIPISLAAVGAASAAIADSATQREVLRQHSEQIQTLSQSNDADRKALRDEIKTIPQMVRDTMDTHHSKTEGVSLNELFQKMNMSQQLRLQKLLDEAGIKNR